MFVAISNCFSCSASLEISPDAKAVISGPHDLHFKAGSAIILNCVVKQPSVKDIGPIYWYRGEHMITPFDADDDEEEDEEVQDDKQGKEETVAAKTGQGKGEMPGTQPDQSLNEVLSTELQRDFASRIAMESQLGDTLKSRLVLDFLLHFSCGFNFPFLLPFLLLPQAAHIECSDNGHWQLHVPADDGKQRQCHGSCD